MNNHAEYIKQALTVAKKQAIGEQGHVGAVLVSEGEVISQGASNDERGFHAEQTVFEDLLQVPHNSTLYVTIQPGMNRTDPTHPSDSEIIANTGIMHVVIGALNDKVHENQSREFFAKHNMSFTVLDDEETATACIDYFTKTGGQTK